MSKKFFCYCLSALVISSVLLVSCDKDTETVTVYAPSISVSSATITASANGGDYSFTYVISNPTDDGTVSCSASTSWITGVTNTGSGVNFSVTENTTGSSRTGQVVVNYSSAYGSASKTVSVAQNANDVPELTVQPTAVAAEIDGGNYSFTYQVNNPASDGKISCTTSATWIGSFDYSTTGKVGFTVSANSTTSLREGVISVIYTYGYGELEETVTVIQDHEGGSGGSGGSGDVSEVIGTYLCTGKVADPNSTTGKDVMDASWYVKIFANNVDSGYNLYIDGICYEYEGAYDYYGDHRCSALANYTSDGKIVIPSQLIDGTTVNVSGTSYYFGYTACVDYDTTNGFYYSSEWPSITFSTSGGGWVSNYGVMAIACGTTSLSSMTYLLDVSIPTLSMTKTSSTTSVKSLNNNVPANPLEESAYFNSNFSVK